MTGSPWGFRRKEETIYGRKTVAAVRAALQIVPLGRLRGKVAAGAEPRGRGLPEQRKRRRHVPPVLLVKKTPGKAEGLRQRKTQKERDRGAGRSLVFFRGLCSHGENVGWIVGF